MQTLCLSEEPRSHTRDQSTSLNRFPLTLEDNFIKCILQSPKTRSCKAPLSLERSFVLPPALTRPATLSWHAQVHLPPLCIAANSFQVGSTCQRLQHCTRCILFPCFATQNTAVRLLLRIHLTWMPQSQTETQQLCSKAPWPPWGGVAWMGPCPPQGSPRLGAFPGPLGGLGWWACWVANMREPQGHGCRSSYEEIMQQNHTESGFRSWIPLDPSHAEGAWTGSDRSGCPYGETPRKK